MVNNWKPYILSANSAYVNMYVQNSEQVLYFVRILLLFCTISWWPAVLIYDYVKHCQNMSFAINVHQIRPRDSENCDHQLVTSAIAHGCCDLCVPQHMSTHAVMIQALLFRTGGDIWLDRASFILQSSSVVYRSFRIGLHRFLADILECLFLEHAKPYFWLVDTK